MRLKVGEFSRLCQVSVKTLRYYDEIGLFTPADIDRFTSYRHYTLDQLPRIHRIMALKELGLSLEQIAELVNSDLPLEQIRDLFLRQQQEIQQQINEALERLALVQFHLRQLETEATLPGLPIVIKQLPALPALTLRAMFHDQQAIDQTGHEILHAGAQGKLRGTTTPMGIAYVDEFTRHDLDYEFVLPIEGEPPQDVMLESGRALRLREVAGLPLAATYLHQGDYDGLNEAWISVQRWAVENGYQLGREMRMVYFRGPMHRAAPVEYLTELQHQIERVSP
jgi:DNA-binding transcriptional MerR regulator